MIQLTSSQIQSILALSEQPSISFAGITCHKSGNVQVTVSSTVDANQIEVEGLIIDIFPLAQYEGKPSVTEYENLISELFIIETGVAKVSVDMHMVKTVEGVTECE